MADFLSDKWRIPLKSSSGDVVYGKGQAQKNQVVIAKPQTYMNLSGTPLRRFNAEPEDLIVIHDDLDLPPGSVRVKFGGGTGGHKGLESIFENLGHDRFIRIRCGIGRPPEGMETSDYVLGLFPEQDLELVRKQIENAGSAIELCLREGHVKAMNLFNRRQKDVPEEKE